jgi:hypothetical protein
MTTAELVQVAIGAATWASVALSMRSSRRKTEDRVLELVEKSITQKISTVAGKVADLKEITSDHGTRISMTELGLARLATAHEVRHPVGSR